MISAINAGIAGLKAADMRVNIRAQNIVNWQSQGYQPLVPVQTSQGSGPVVKVTKAELSTEFPQVDLAEEIVDMNVAQTAYEASAKDGRPLHVVEVPLKLEP